MPAQRIHDPYATLGAGRDASLSQLRAAYRRLAKRYHPDLQSDARAPQKMRQINQAWELLSSPSRRAEYDASVTARQAAQAGGHWDAPRRAAPVQAAGPSWSAAYGPVHAGARAYARGAAGAYADAGADRSPRVLRWAVLLLLVPVAVLSAAILTAGILPFPLLGVLVLVIAGRLFDGER